MPEPSMAEIMDGISHLLDDLDQIARIAHRRYRGYAAEILIEHSPRATATCIYDHMVAEADRRFLDRDGVRPIDVRGLKLWIVGIFAAVRLKKMDEDGKSRNYPTKQAKAFDTGKELPGLPPAPIRLTAGYLLDPTGTEFIRTQVARPAGRSIAWCAAVVPAEERKVGERIWVDATRQGSF
jgi:hypothetical protein